MLLRSIKSFARHVLICLCLAPASASVLAACNDPNDWMMSPHEGVKWVVDTTSIEWAVSILHDPMNGINVKASPFPLTPELAEKVGKGPLSFDQDSAPDRAYLLYYESDFTGGWRLCRAEEWWYLTGERAKSTQKLSAIRQRYMTATGANSLISEVTQGWRLNGADILLYNAKGQLSETFTTYLDRDTDKIQVFDTRCARYDDRGRETLYDEPVNDICPTGKPDPMDRYRAFEYGQIEGRVRTIRNTSHVGYPEDKGWSEDIDSLKPFFWAIQDSWHGLTRFQISHDFLPRDLSEHNARRETSHPEYFDPVEYYFPNDKVFLSDIEPDFSRVYRYDRRREVTDQSQAWDLQEFFKANSNIPSYRFQVVRGRTERQEQLDAQGRVTRIIDVGRRQKPQFADEAFELPFKLKGHEIYYRVWDVAPDGKKTLVALGWNASLRPFFGAGEDRDTLDTAQVIYGLPDGTEKWNDDQFAEHFGYDEDATPVWKGKEASPRPGMVPPEEGIRDQGQSAGAR